MDPIAHTFTGAALAAAGLRRATPLATAALVLGANAPDVDAGLLLIGDYLYLAHRRGWTHGLPAMAVWPLVVTGIVLAWDRWVRRAWAPHSAPARAGRLLALSALAVLTHPTLDWLNTYGMRWLMPFEGRWFYGDALFIIDPWVWLALGGVLFLTWSRRPVELAAWSGFWLLTSVLVLTNGQVTRTTQILWIAGVVAVLAARTLGFGLDGRRRVVEYAARFALAGVGLYMAANVAANLPARAEVLAELSARGIGPVIRVMVGPAPGNPFAGTVIAETTDRYYLGTWRWLRRPRFELADEHIPLRPAHDPMLTAAAQTVQVRRFLTWSRFPYVQIESGRDGHIVIYGDARYPRNGTLLPGPTVRLDANLQVVDVR